MSIEEKKSIVSVIVPTYNSSVTLRRTVDSILSQSYQDFEIIIIDDCSSDDTISIVRGYMAKDHRIKLISKKMNSGVADSRNKGIALAKGKYIAFLDSDDIWLPSKLQNQINFMIKNEYNFTYTNYVKVEGLSEKTIISPRTLDYKSLKKKNSIGCLTVIYDQEKLGKIKIPLLEKRNDYALWLTILRNGGVAWNLNETQSVYHVMDNSLSSGSKIRLVKHHYLLFRLNEKMNPLQAIFCTIRNVFYVLID